MAGENVDGRENSGGKRSDLYAKVKLACSKSAIK